MSYSKILNMLNSAKEGTLIRKVICSDNFSKISDVDKSQYPLLHCMIVSAPISFSPSEVMFNNWNITAYLYMGDAEGKSKGDLSIDDVNSINIQMESMIANYVRNIYRDQNINNIESAEFTTSIPVKINGANVWQLSMTISMMNGIECNDC